MGHFGYHPWLLKSPLLAFVQIGQFHSGIEGDLLFVYHVQQFRDEVGQTDKAPYLISTVASFLTNNIGSFQLPPNLGGS